MKKIDGLGAAALGLAAMAGCEPGQMPEPAIGSSVTHPDLTKPPQTTKEYSYAGCLSPEFNDYRAYIKEIRLANNGRDGYSELEPSAGFRFKPETPVGSERVAFTLTGLEAGQLTDTHTLQIELSATEVKPDKPQDPGLDGQLTVSFNGVSYPVKITSGYATKIKGVDYVYFAVGLTTSQALLDFKPANSYFSQELVIPKPSPDKPVRIGISLGTKNTLPSNPLAVCHEVRVKEVTYDLSSPDTGTVKVLQEHRVGELETDQLY